MIRNLGQAPPTFEHIQQAAARLNGVSARTPLLESQLLNEQLGLRLLVKAEALQRTGSFKFRGAYNMLSRHAEQFRRTGIVAYSGGNHAQGAAAAASMLGIDAIVLMPSDAPKLKIERTKAYGATVRQHDRFRDDRDAIAAEIIERTGRVLVPSFDHPDIISGQGTVGIEIAEQCREMNATPDLLLLCCGGGGLCAGTSLATKTLLPKMKVFGVEPTDFDDTRRSLAGTERANNSPDARSICDALLTQCGELTLSMNRRTLDGVRTVSDQQVCQAMATLLTEFKVVAEPGGAVAVAVALVQSHRDEMSLFGKTVVATVSGGNVERDTYIKALTQAGN